MDFFTFATTRCDLQKLHETNCSAVFINVLCLNEVLKVSVEKNCSFERRREEDRFFSSPIM